MAADEPLRDIENDYHVTVSDDIYITFHKKMKYGDIILFDTNKTELSFLVPHSYKADEPIPLIKATDEFIFKIFPFLKGKFPIGYDMLGNTLGFDHRGGGHAQPNVKRFDQTEIEPEPEGLTEDGRISTINQTYAMNIAERAEERLKKEQGEHYRFFATVNSPTMVREAWKVKISVSESFGHIANFEFFAPDMMDGDGEIDPAKRDACATVEEHVVRTVLGGLSNYG
jgi:hypothetical protein